MAVSTRGRPEPGPDAAHVALARGRDQRREGHPDRGRRSEQLFYAKLDCFVDLGPRQKGAHMSRFEEVVNDAIGEVDPRRERVPRRDAGPAHRREGARPPGRAARRGAPRGALSRSTSRRRDSGIRTQEIYTLHGIAVAGAAGTRRLVGVTAQGMTACPCAQTLVQASSRERLLADGFDERRDRAHLRRRAGRDPQPARARHAARRLPRGVRHRHRRPAPAGDRRGLDVVGDLRADEALGRGRGGREGAPPAALRRGLRARDDPRRRRAAARAARRRVRLGAPGEPRDDPPAQRRRRPLRPAGRAARTSSRRASTPSATSRCATGSTASSGR